MVVECSRVVVVVAGVASVAAAAPAFTCCVSVLSEKRDGVSTDRRGQRIHLGLSLSWWVVILPPI